jgi:putative membrane protein insertion efficiency factor
MSRLVIFFISIYQRTLSPLLGDCCRFYPSCSAYTIQALQQYGLVKGLFMGLRRILKCHPFHPGGYDPLPLDASQKNREHIQLY